VILTTPHNPVEEDQTTPPIMSDTPQGAVLMGSRVCLVNHSKVDVLISLFVKKQHQPLLLLLEVGVERFGNSA